MVAPLRRQQLPEGRKTRHIRHCICMGAGKRQLVAFDESGYIKTGWMRDEDYNGWFYFDPEHGMQTGWVLIDGKCYYFHPTSDGRKGILYVGRLTPDGYYVDENGVWDGKDRQ